MAGALALAVHELATNASKYGALSSSDGSASVTWRVFEGRVTLDWKEIDGPPVTPPNREGYGARVIRHLGVRQPGGTVNLKYEPEGVHCRFGFNAVG
jgi:two-component sensor histidine kinase